MNLVAFLVAAALAAWAARPVVVGISQLRGTIERLGTGQSAAAFATTIDELRATHADVERMHALLAERTQHVDVLHQELVKRAEQAERERDAIEAACQAMEDRQAELEQEARADALEEAAQETEKVGNRWLGRGAQAFAEVAAAIRALATTSEVLPATHSVASCRLTTRRVNSP